jgi:voltage-gated potassium channel
MSERRGPRGARALLQRMLLRRAVAERSRGREGSFPKLLYTRPAVSPERTLAMRGMLVVGLLLFVMLVFWLDRDQLRDSLDGEVSLVDVVYFTFVTVTTVGYGDIVPIGDRARLIDALLVTPIRILVLFVFLGTAYEFVFQRIIEDMRMNALHDSLKDHVIICGFGSAGRTAAREMVAKGYRKDRIVIIDMRPERLEDAAQAGYVGLRGDATRDLVMREARVELAKAVLVCVSRDDTTVLVTLTARSINQRMRIVAEVRDEENLALVRKAGADQVVSPSKLAGFLIADAVESRYMMRFITDILTERGGKIKIAERKALPDEVGQAISQVRGRLLVAIERGGKIYGFWDHPDELIRGEDLVFAIEPYKRSAG